MNITGFEFQCQYLMCMYNNNYKVQWCKNADFCMSKVSRILK